ncbi:MAG: hypothetical protein U9R48_02035 [Chloroflexota bacterium]|nr:hypothetical protein [Chloroflexota bacterium]
MTDSTSAQVGAGPEAVGLGCAASSVEEGGAVRVGVPVRSSAEVAVGPDTG